MVYAAFMAGTVDIFDLKTTYSAKHSGVKQVTEPPPIYQLISAARIT